MEGEKGHECEHTPPSKGEGIARTATKSWATKKTGVKSIVGIEECKVGHCGLYLPSCGFIYSPWRSAIGS